MCHAERLRLNGPRFKIQDLTPFSFRTYVVNDAGETIRQIGPRGPCTESRFDGRGRVWQRLDYTSHSGTSCSGSLEAQANWLFDTASHGIGALAEENSSVNGTQRIKRTFAYDSLGRASSVTTLIDNKTYTESSTYDQYGRAYQSFFSTPGVNQTGELVEYNSQGYQFRVRSAFTLVPYDPNLNLGVIYNEVTKMNARGQITDEVRMAGAHVETEREYDVSTGRLKRILTGGGFLQDLSYDYDKLGNVAYRQDTTDLAHTLREDFTYDKLQRLLTSTVQHNGSVASNQDLSYTGDGNISTKTGLGAYTYGTRPTLCNGVSGSAKPGPHAVSLVNNTSYCYDTNGNLLRTFVGSTSDKLLTWTAYDQVATMSSALANSKVGFDYGPNRERIRRLDYSDALATAATSLTHFVGSAEVRWTASGTNPGAFEEVRRYLGGVIIVQRGTGSSQTVRREYLLTDAQGSTYAVLDDYGMPINETARMSFDPFGKRRATADWNPTAPWTLTTLNLQLKETTRRGYTGHEQVDSVGIIHMGGRIYDPQLGRFLQADPFIQAPGNSQSLNRYTYVFNNPMAWTDPTGYWGAKEQAGLRTVVAIAIAVISGGTASGLVAAEAYGEAAAVAFAGGFAAGAIQSGNLRGAVVGGISSLAFFGVSQAFPVKGMNLASGKGLAAYSKLALASGITGGVMAELQGGRFGNGFVTAGANAYLAPIPEAASANAGVQTVIAAVIGGTVSQASGGKFANGAVTSAFQFALGRAIGTRDGPDSESPTGSGQGGRKAGIPNLQADAFLIAESSMEGYAYPMCFGSEDAAQAAAANRYTGAVLAAYREANWRVFEVGPSAYSFTYPSITAYGSRVGQMPPQDRVPYGKYLNGGHAHWDGNTDFSGHDWTWVTGNRRTLYLSAGDGRLQYSTPAQARPYGIGPMNRGAPSTFPGMTVPGVSIRSDFP